MNIYIYVADRIHNYNASFNARLIPWRNAHWWIKYMDILITCKCMLHLKQWKWLTSSILHSVSRLSEILFSEKGKWKGNLNGTKEASWYWYFNYLDAFHFTIISKYLKSLFIFSYFIPIGMEQWSCNHSWFMGVCLFLGSRHTWSPIASKLPWRHGTELVDGWW